MKSNRVRVRFAPSPTGPLHMGGVRTALYNYLFAKKNGGDFLLRIEDTDQNRYVPGAEDYIIRSLDWCGLKADEGPDDLGGSYGPYRQSERKDIYPQYVQQLLDSGNAYYAFDTAEELDRLRKACEAEKKVFTYNAVSRKNLKNSLTLSEEETAARIAAKDPYVVRFKMPEDETIRMTDLIRGDISVHTRDLDDKILFKSDGMPTYHLANIVDDHLMKITHVIRGEEWLPSMPLHILLYRAFGWDAPQFAHLPLILKPSGNGKLSKRDGDKLGFPVFPLEWHSSNGEIYSGYREKGYLPGAFINMLALLGWNEGTEQEIYSMDELIQAFSLEKVGKSGSRFDPDKTRWFNEQYIKALSADEFYKLALPSLQDKGVKDSAYAQKVVSKIKERCAFPSEVWEHASFFFEAPKEYDQAVIKKRWKEYTPKILTAIAEIIRETEDFSPAGLHEAVVGYIQMNNLNMGEVMNCLRLSLVGAAKGPDLFEIVTLLGKDEVCKRINSAIKQIAL